MDPLDSTIWFGGLVMAHAVWIVSEIEEGSLLCPFALLQTGDERQFIAFESETQAEAVLRGKASFSEHRDAVDFWGFARDGLMSRPESAQEKVDVLTVSSWRRDLDEPVTLLQRYVPKVSGQFRLLGEMEIGVHGMVTLEPVQTSFRSLAMSGVESHPQGALWLTWSSQ
jgi:hypothetical protein